MDVWDAANQIERIMEGETPDIDGAYDWALQYTWEEVCKKWQRIFDSAALDARTASRPNRETRRKLKV